MIERELIETLDGEWIESGRVQAGPEPSWDEWSASVALSFMDWLDENDERLWWAIENRPEVVLSLSPWMNPVGMFPPASMSWQEWMAAAIEADPSCYFTATPEMFPEPAKIEVKKERVVEQPLFQGA